MLLLLSTLGCAKSDVEITGDVWELYGKTFIVKAVRANSSASWYLVGGTQLVSFTGVEGATSGDFKIQMSGYYEPQFCSFGQTCSCDATLSGTISKGAETKTTTTDKNYDIFDPYTDNTTTTTTSEDNTETKTIYDNLILLTFSSKMLSSACSSQIDRNIIIRRFASGEILLIDGTKESTLVEY